jgi:HEAT repeat protein
MEKNRMCLRGIVFIFVAASALATRTFCQDTVSASVGGPASTAGLLKVHHVDLTTESLVRALKNPDAQVRYLAAEKLAEDNKREAIPSIAVALTAESAPAARVNIAYALAMLKDDRGVTALNAQCENSDIPGFLRVRAAGYLLNLHSESCLDSILGILESGADPDSQSQALSLLPEFHRASNEDSQRIFDLVVKGLAEQTPAVRIEASITLGRLRNTSAIPYIESAMGNEKDEAVRSQMQAAIEALQREEATPGVPRHTKGDVKK